MMMMIVLVMNKFCVASTNLLHQSQPLQTGRIGTDDPQQHMH